LPVLRANSFSLALTPLEHKRAERDRRAAEEARSVTFKTCTERYYAAHADGWSKKHRQQFVGTMRDYVYPLMGALSVAAIDESLVLKVLNPIWKTKNVTAKRVRNRIASVLDYAAAARYRSGTNPARWEGNLEFLLPKPERIVTVQHHAALPYAEISSFMAALRASPSSAGHLDHSGRTDEGWSRTPSAVIGPRDGVVIGAPARGGQPSCVHRRAGW